jgi:TolB-like protein
MRAGTLALAVVACAARQAAAQCPDGSPPPCRTRAAARAAAAPPNSIAVLYFANNSPDTADSYLADGLTDELITQLGRLPRLAVAPRGVVRRFRGRDDDPTTMAQQLNVAFLVTGGVRRAGTRLRVDVELVRASGMRRVWGESYQRTDGDLFAIQEDIARAITQAVAGRLLPAERAQLARAPTRDPVAYDLYLRAATVFYDVSPASLQRGIALLDSALQRDPAFAAARGRQAFLYGWAVNWRLVPDGVPADSLLQLGQRVADRALRDDSASSDAWMARSFLLFFRDPPDLEGAVNAARRSVALDSTSGQAHQNLAVVLRRLGRYDEAVGVYHRGLAAEPGGSQSIADLGFIAYSRRRYREALVWYDSANAVSPGAWHHLMYQARARLAAGDTAAARNDARLAAELAGAPVRHMALSLRAVVEARSGDLAGARALIEPVAQRFATGPVSVRDGYEVVAALVATGQRERALDLLERIRPRAAWLWSYLVFPDFDELRSEPRFERVFTEARPRGAPAIP